MKKIIELLLTLTLLLTACAAPAQPPEPTPAPTPAQTPTPAPTPEPEPESLAGELIPQDVGAPLPEQEFEVDSVWGTPEPDGRVMLLLSARDGGEVSAALYDAGMLTDSFGPEAARTVAEILAEPQPRTVKFTARSVGDGKFYDTANAISLAVDGDTLSFSDSELTIDLIRLTDSEAPLAWARMPLFAEELKMPAPLEGSFAELLEIYGEAVETDEYNSRFELETDAFGMYGSVHEAADGGKMYHVFGYLSRANGGHHISARGIEIGDSAAEAAARFPNPGRLPDCSDSGGYGQLYGSSRTAGCFGSINCTADGIPEMMVYSAGIPFIKLYFDENGYLDEISLCLQLW